MAGFCVKCGKPLPEDGVCPCTQAAEPQAPYQQPVYQQVPYQQVPYQQPAYQQNPYQQAPQQGYPVYVQVKQGPSVFGNFFKVLGNYFKDPVGTTRTAYEKKDIASSLITMCASILFTLLGTLFFSLVWHNDWFIDFGDLVPAWIVLGLFSAPIAYGLTWLLAFASAKLSGSGFDPAGALAAVGVSAILPAVLLAASMLLSMIDPLVFEIMAILTVGAWVVNAFTLIIQVLKVKMNILNTLVLIAGFAVAYIVMVLLLNWFVFDGNIKPFIDTIGDLGFFA